MANDSLTLFPLMFEFIATFILGFTFAVTLNDSLRMGLALWLCGLIGAKVSGAHVNPAITLAHMIRYQSRISVPIGLFYMVIQFLGAFIGGLMVWWSNQLTNFGPQIRLGEDGKVMWAEAMFLQTFGTFAITLIFLMNSQERTRLSSERWVDLLLVAITLSLGITWAYGTSTGVFNPAIGLGIDLASVTSRGSSPTVMRFTWVYIIFPFLGAILATGFFELLYKRAVMQRIEQVEMEQKR